MDCRINFEVLEKQLKAGRRMMARKNCMVWDSAAARWVMSGDRVHYEDVAYEGYDESEEEDNYLPSLMSEEEEEVEGGHGCLFSTEAMDEINKQIAWQRHYTAQFANRSTMNWNSATREWDLPPPARYYEDVAYEGCEEGDDDGDEDEDVNEDEEDEDI